MGEVDRSAHRHTGREAGNTYYTRVSFHVDEGVHLATNYSRGIVWPINTQVKLVKLKSRKFVLQRVDTGAKVTVENVEDHTQVDTKQLVSRMLSTERTPIEKLSAEFQAAVKGGQLRLGMSKEVAVMARGYPPGHKTPSLDLDTWIYWENRFVTTTILFNNGVITKGRGLH